MENRMKKVGKVSSFLTKYIGVIIICFSVIAFFWRDGFAWTTSYTSVFLGVAMFGMGLTIKMDDFKRVFSRPKEILIGFIAQYTIMPVIAWILCQVMQLPTDLALGVILVGCCPGGTASNVITYIAGGDVALSVGMTITSTLAAPIVTPLLVYVLAGAWVEVSFWAMVISVVKVVLVPVLLGILINWVWGKQIQKISEVLPLISVVSIVMIISGIVAVNAEKILSCGLLVLGVVMLHTIRQLPLPSKSECRTVDLQSPLQLPISWQIHWQPFRGRSSVYGIIYPDLCLQGSAGAENRRKRHIRKLQNKKNPAILNWQNRRIFLY